MFIAINYQYVLLQICNAFTLIKINKKLEKKILAIKKK